MNKPSTATIYHSIVTALVAQEKPEAIAKTIGEVGAAPQPEAHVGLKASPAKGGGPLGEVESSLFSQALAQHGQGGPSEATSVVFRGIGA